MQIQSRKIYTYIWKTNFLTKVQFNGDKVVLFSTNIARVMKSLYAKARALKHNHTLYKKLFKNEKQTQMENQNL